LSSSRIKDDDKLTLCCGTLPGLEIGVHATLTVSYIDEKSATPAVLGERWMYHPPKRGSDAITRHDPPDRRISP